MVFLFLPVGVSVAAGTAYFACRSVDFRKFLAGAFFVSGSVQIYLAAVGVTVPVVGTTLAQTPVLGWVRGTIHLIFAVLCFYAGFVRRRTA